jgi:hypothetical protein
MTDGSTQTGDSEGGREKNEKATWAPVEADVDEEITERQK